MTLSKADIKGALSGVLFLLITILVVDVILGLVSGNLLTAFTQEVLGIASYLLCILVLAFVISIIAVLISYVFRAVKRR